MVPLQDLKLRIVTREHYRRIIDIFGILTLKLMNWSGNGASLLFLTVQALDLQLLGPQSTVSQCD